MQVREKDPGKLGMLVTFYHKPTPASLLGVAFQSACLQKVGIMANIEVLDFLSPDILTSLVHLRLGNFIDAQMRSAQVSVNFAGPSELLGILHDIANPVMGTGHNYADLFTILCL
jgi:prolipoprotein diacylglyceryltransferase